MSLFYTIYHAFPACLLPCITRQELPVQQTSKDMRIFLSKSRLAQQKTTVQKLRKYDTNERRHEYYVSKTPCPCNDLYAKLNTEITSKLSEDANRIMLQWICHYCPRNARQPISTQAPDLDCAVSRSSSQVSVHES